MTVSQELFGQVAAERRYEAVVRQILALISHGEIAPGSRLPAERDLAERLGVSRNVLREAFRVLEARGIVRSRAGGGRFVRADNLSAARSIADAIAAGDADAAEAAVRKHLTHTRAAVLER